MPRAVDESPFHLYTRQNELFDPWAAEGSDGNPCFEGGTCLVGQKPTGEVDNKIVFKITPERIQMIRPGGEWNILPGGHWYPVNVPVNILWAGGVEADSLPKDV